MQDGFFGFSDSEISSGYGITLGLFAGFLFEEKKVCFDMPEKWWSYILRPVIGVGLFAAASALLKIPGNAITNDTLAFIYRVIRYAISSFIVNGLYPLLFKKLHI